MIEAIVEDCSKKHDGLRDAHDVCAVVRRLGLNPILGKRPQLHLARFPCTCRHHSSATGKGLSELSRVSFSQERIMLVREFEREEILGNDPAETATARRVENDPRCVLPARGKLVLLTDEFRALYRPARCVRRAITVRSNVVRASARGGSLPLPATLRMAAFPASHYQVIGQPEPIPASAPDRCR